MEDGTLTGDKKHMKWLVTVSPDLAAVTISMLSTSHCWNQQSKILLLKLLKYSLEWCSLSIFSYEKYRILSVVSCQMHKPTTTKPTTPKSTPQSLLLEQSSSFMSQICFIQTHFTFVSPIHCLVRWNFFLPYLSLLYIYLYRYTDISESLKRWKRNEQSGYG